MRRAEGSEAEGSSGGEFGFVVEALDDVAGAVGKYAKRLEQIPAKTIEEWRLLTGGEQLVAAISLTAENSVFPNERFSAQGFRALATKFK